MKLRFSKIIEKSAIFIVFGVLFGCHAGTLKIQYYPTGEKQFEYYLQNDVPEGIAKEYYKNGNLKSEINMKDGFKDGDENLYYDDGHLEAIVKYKHGIQDDTMKIYYENGNLREISFYADSAKTGPFKTFYTNGHLSMEGHSIKGLYAGVCKYYDSVTGILSQVVWCTSEGGYVGRGDSIDFKLIRIATKDSELHISVPSKWVVKYNQNGTYENHPFGMQILAVKPDRNIDTNKVKLTIDLGETGNDTVHAFVMVLIDSDTHKNVSLHEIIANTLGDLKKSGMLVNATDILDLTIDGCESTSVRVISQQNGVRTSSTTTSIRHNGKIYQIAGRAPLAKYGYYMDLFDEITRGITFRKH